MTPMEIFFITVLETIKTAATVYYTVTPVDQLVALGLIVTMFWTFSYRTTKSKVVNNTIQEYTVSYLPGRTLKAIWIGLIYYSQHNLWVALILIVFSIAAMMVWYPKIFFRD